ncbi:MAG: phosphoglycerate dehydrogenase [Candidatus Nanopelagicales bacterium]|jgi:D-3-phosphoglycerate dehydrogenase|nr:phosphoglycerate dehydrogenase [Candidatus Nanopelagicales bacterium]MBJ7394149.1 phosphoglycerate dehydrogenase [Candidatus Nanopelagicales bacterium]
MSNPIVLIAEELSPATVKALGPDFEIRNCDGANREELFRSIVDADAILVRSATKLDSEALSHAKKLRIIARAGVGLDNVDVAAATTQGIMVVNAPTSNITSAAELAVSLLLASARNIVPANIALKKGEWKRSKFTGIELSEKTIGIVGFGRIGVLVAQRLAGFGVHLIAYDPFVQPAKAATHNVKMVSLDELLEQSDFITVHLPKTPETAGLIGEEALKKVKPTVRIINASRGGIVNEQALFTALKEGRVAGAGIDVYDSEPCTDSPLFTLDQVVSTPHLGASTDEAQEKAGIAVAKSVRLALSGELVPDAVNVSGGAIAKPVRPLLPLVENMGRIAAGLVAGAINRVHVEVSGEVVENELKILEISAMKGILTQLVHEPVSYVNAPLLAKDRGIETSLHTTLESPNFKVVAKVELTTNTGEVASASGTITGPNSTIKLVGIDKYELDVAISDQMAFIQYEDRPGMIGIIGGILGKSEINIANLQLARETKGGNALVVLTLDSEIPQSVLSEIANALDAKFAKTVNLS